MGQRNKHGRISPGVHISDSGAWAHIQIKSVLIDTTHNLSKWTVWTIPGQYCHRSKNTHFESQYIPVMEVICGNMWKWMQKYLLWSGGRRWWIEKRFIPFVCIIKYTADTYVHAASLLPVLSPMCISTVPTEVQGPSERRMSEEVQQREVVKVNVNFKHRRRPIG